MKLGAPSNDACNKVSESVTSYVSEVEPSTTTIVKRGDLCCNMRNASVLSSRV